MFKIQKSVSLFISPAYFMTWYFTARLFNTLSRRRGQNIQRQREKDTATSIFYKWFTNLTHFYRVCLKRFDGPSLADTKVRKKMFNHKQIKQSEAKNNSLWPEAIFGVDNVVTEILSRPSFAANYSKVPDIAAEMYECLRLDEVIAREELSYYATAMLWLRLLEVKAKQGDAALTIAEEDIRTATSNDEFNIPRPLYAYLLEIGVYTDNMGTETRLEVAALPTTIVQNFGGYHAASVNVDTHNLFEEVPSLGIAGDMVMALVSVEAEAIPNLHIVAPEGTVFTDNLVGRFSPIGPGTLEIRQRLFGYGITSDLFQEYVPRTRFNLRYVRSLSDILGRFEAEKMRFRDLTMSGGKTQAIMARPSEKNERDNWRVRTVRGTSAANSSTADMGAAYCFGFQLFKEPGEGDTVTHQALNWSCVAPMPNSLWVMPDMWNNNRNDRRKLPPGLRTERFMGNSLRQDLKLSDAVRRMVRTARYE